MEEFIGKVWHKWITRQAVDNHDSTRIELTDLKDQLGPFYRGLGGDPAKMITASPATRFNSKQALLQRIAGINHKHAVCWQDEDTINLPPTIGYFAEPALNQALYFWLTALAAKIPQLQHWFQDNQHACAELLQERPGLAKVYRRLVKASIETRIPLQQLQGNARLREEAIRAALLEPGSVKQLPQAKGEPQPVLLWIYPAPLRAVSVKADDPQDNESTTKSKPEELSNTRKQARRVDDSKETDGLLVFQLESMCSWTEQIELDRCQDEDMDDDLQMAAEDLDIISLSRQRRAGSAKIKFDLDLPAAQNDDLALGDGIRLPEWDYRKAGYIKDYCLLQPMLADDAAPAAIPEHLSAMAHTLKKRFSVLRTQINWQKRQPFGEEIDIDSWLRHISQPVQDVNRQDYYQTRITNNRDIACLLLADLSMSTDAILTEEQNVIDVIRDTLLLFSEALNDADDKFAIYGFSSVKNTHVRYHLLKNFAESYSDITRGRILATKPGFYTRMGAAIRQSAEILKNQHAEQRLLMMISDGKPNDIDRYEGRYGIEDTRRAINEAKQLGLQPFCVTIDDKANEYLPYLFGDKGFVIVNDAAKLPLLLPRLYLKLTTMNT